MSTSFATRNKVQSLDRALEMLKLLGSEPEMRVTDLARRLEVHKSTAFRLLWTLQEHGLVEQNPTTERYRLGYGLVRLAGSVVAEFDLARASRPVLEELAVRTSETVNLAILQGDQVVNIDQIAAPHLVVNVNWVGKQTPLHCTSNGKVLLAFLPDADRARLLSPPLARFTPRTITDLKTLEKQLRRAVLEGYAFTLEELELGLNAVAAPSSRHRWPGAGGGQRGGTLVSSHPPSAPGTRRDDEGGGRGDLAADGLFRNRGRTDMSREEEIRTELFDHTLNGHAPEVKALTEEGLKLGMDPMDILFKALIPSLEEVGRRFEKGDFFVPEMLIAARAMQGALVILRPLIAETGAKPIGKYVIGTVKGDIHDIGKNLVIIMLEGAGFEVVDLGVNCPPEKFVEAVRANEPHVVGFSAFLTTTMPMFKGQHRGAEEGRPS